jgi:cholesterol transport system auxiliary component
VVEPPFASAALNTTRVALMPSPTRIDYYARASWEDQAPLMVQTLLVESFENSRRIVSVGRQSIGLRSDFVLKTELREFQAEIFEAGRPIIRARLNAKLVRMPERSIIAATDIERTALANSDSIEAVVEAFDEALGKVMRGIVVWTLQSATARGS